MHVVKSINGMKYYRTNFLSYAQVSEKVIFLVGISKNMNFFMTYLRHELMQAFIIEKNNS